jgi:hypothetical protein
MIYLFLYLEGEEDMDYDFNSHKNFLREVRETLSPEDYLDFLEGIADHESFCDADEDIQNLVLDYMYLNYE